VAGDATKSYSDKKCRLALRQFVFLNPDFFVIFDRVVSKKPEFKKTWLLHTATEPSINKQVFSAYHEQGRLFAKTLLPEKAELVKIGGYGKQFWINNRNYPMPENNAVPDSTQLLGQWRVEVNTAEQKNETLFLHLIQVGDLNLKEMTASELVKKGKRAGVRFSFGSREWEVLFGTDGKASGHISIKQDSRFLVNRELTKKNAPQSGLFGTE